jgi:hypothetical protein
MRTRRERGRHGDARLDLVWQFSAEFCNDGGEDRIEGDTICDLENVPEVEVPIVKSTKKLRGLKWGKSLGDNIIHFPGFVRHFLSLDFLTQQAVHTNESHKMCVKRGS